MAFDGLRGTFTGNGNAVGATNALTGSVAVSIGDLVRGSSHRRCGGADMFLFCGG